MTIDKSIDEVTPAEFDALLLPGGHSPDYLRGDNRFVTFTRDFVNSGKPVFCHLSRPAVADQRRCDSGAQTDRS